jgi:TP901 family phage tail tape measure protein
MSDLRLGVDVNTRQAEAKIAKLADRPLKLNLKDSISQPLGRITGQVSEFNKSLEASNARVLAFGASAGAIFAVQRSLSATIKSAIEVEKALLDINVVLGVSSKSLAVFGGALFDIAKNTGQSFKVVANAATELARQGLSVQQTLQRTSDALILTRLSGLDTVTSVEALTAAVNTFSKAGITSTQVINKFANVDAGFAVSSADLAEALSRVGSTAQDVGVDLDQLIALVTAAQQTTARGGSVIGNSFKTIFTRLQRTDTLDALEEVGVKVRDLEGQALPAIQILNNLAGSFQNLSKSQQAATAEAVGGVFQINVLRSTLGDLGKEYSIYDGALRTSASSTNEAIKRNEALNTSLSSLVNKTFVNLNQAAAEIGNIVFAPAATGSLDAFNSILDAFNQPKETEGVGSKIAKGLLGGLGSYLSGPGLAVIGTVFIKLFSGLTVFGAEALKTLLNISSGSDKIAQSQSRVNAILAQNPQLIQAIMSKEMSLLQVEQQILNVIRQQNAARSVASTISTSIAPRVPAPRKYGGFIPNFADAEIMGAKSEGYSAQRSFEVNNPVLGKVTVNNREKTNSVPVGGYPPGSFIVNPNQLGQVAGVPLEPIESMRNKGFIPNFAKQERKKYQVIRGDKTPNKYVAMIYPQKSDSPQNFVGMGIYGDKKVPIRFQGSGYNAKKAVKPDDANLEKQLGENVVRFTNKFISNVFGNQQPQARVRSIDDLANRGSFDSIVGAVFETAVGYATGNLNEGRSQNAPIDFANPNQKLKDLFNFSKSSYQLEAKGNPDTGNRNSVAQKILDLGLISGDLKGQLAGKLGAGYKEEVEARRKKTESSYLRRKSEQGPLSSTTSSEYSRMFPWMKGETSERGRFRSLFGSRKASGFIPNFAALEEAIQREQNAGIASSMIRVGSNEKLTNNNNPMGLGVYNTRDEPSGLNQGINRRRSKGFIPNFAMPVTSRPTQRTRRMQDFQPLGSPLPTKIEDSSTTQGGGKNNSSEKAASSLGDLSNKALALSIALPIVTGIVSQFGDQTSTTAKSISYASSLLTGASTGLTLFTSLLGKNGAAFGALTGGALGLYQIMDQRNKQNKENFLNPLKTNAESSSQALQELNGNIAEIAGPLNQVIQDQKEGAEISAESLTALAEKINNLPLNIQEQVRPNLQSGNFDEIFKIINTAASKKERESKSQSLAAGIGQKMVNAKKGENGEFIDIYGDAKAAASDAQDVINNVFSGLNKTEITELNKRLQDAGGNFVKINRILQQAAKDTDADSSALKELNLAYQTGTTNAKALTKEMLKQAAAIEKNANALKKTKVPALGEKQDLTGAGNILGGKESFINPGERYASISEFASGASKYVEGSKSGDTDTKGRGAYEMMSTLVKSGNIKPETFLKTNAKGDFTSPLAASAAEARKQQYMDGGRRYEEIYKETLKPGEKENPEMMKMFKDLQNPEKAGDLANQSIKEFLMSDAQKTYAAFAPTLQDMLGAMELLKAGPTGENFMQQLSVLSQNLLGQGGKAEETRAKMGEEKNKFYGYDFEKTGKISAGSTYGRMQLQAEKGKFKTPEAESLKKQVTDMQYPSLTNPESRLTEKPENASAKKEDITNAQGAMLSTTEYIAKAWSDLSTTEKTMIVALGTLATAFAAYSTGKGIMGGGGGDGGGPIDGLVKGATQTVGKKIAEKGIEKGAPIVGNLVKSIGLEKVIPMLAGLTKTIPALLGSSVSAIPEMGAAAVGGTFALGTAAFAGGAAAGYGISQITIPEQLGGNGETVQDRMGGGLYNMAPTLFGGPSKKEQEERDKNLDDQLAVENKRSEEIKKKKAEKAADAALTPEERGKKQAEQMAEKSSSVNVAPINANINITSNPDTTTQATVAALQAAIDGISEKIRVMQGNAGEKTPPSQLTMKA